MVFMQQFIPSFFFEKYLLNIYYVPNIAQNILDVSALMVLTA